MLKKFLIPLFIFYFLTVNSYSQEESWEQPPPKPPLPKGIRVEKGGLVVLGKYIEKRKASKDTAFTLQFYCDRNWRKSVRLSTKSEKKYIRAKEYTCELQELELYK